MKAGQVLSKAADLIVENGHYQGAYVGPDGKSICALGAINIACGAEIEAKACGSPTGYGLNHYGRTSESLDWSNNARLLLRDYLIERDDTWNPESDTIPNWNDRTDAEKVIHAMRAAAMCDEDGE